MKMIKNKITTLIATILCINVFSQTEGVSIKTTVGPPHSSAMLDVESGSKGILIPRVNLQDTNNVSSPVAGPAEGLMVYNMVNTGNVSKGFYYCTGTKWRKMGTTASELWQKVPSTNQNITYTNGQVIVKKNASLGGTPTFKVIENNQAGAGPVMSFSSDNPSFTNACSIDYHAWSGANGDRLHVSSHLQVNGNLYASNWSSVSDSTLKKDVVAISDAITSINSINPVSFRYKPQSASTDPCSTTNFKLSLDSDLHTGFIAQNIETVFPHAVETVNGKKMVRYTELIAPLLQAVKEQQVIIADLKSRIEALELR